MKAKAHKARRSAAIVSVFILALAGYAPANAEETNSTISIEGVSRSGTVTRATTIEIGDLNRNDAAAQRILAHRISYATKQVCDRSARFGLSQRADYQRCVQTARSEAKAEVARVSVAQASQPRQLSMR